MHLLTRRARIRGDCSGLVTCPASWTMVSALRQAQFATRCQGCLWGGGGGAENGVACHGVPTDCLLEQEQHFSYPTGKPLSMRLKQQARPRPQAWQKLSEAVDFMIDVMPTHHRSLLSPTESGSGKWRYDLCKVLEPTWCSGIFTFPYDFPGLSLKYILSLPAVFQIGHIFSFAPCGPQRVVALSRNLAA